MTYAAHYPIGYPAAIGAIYSLVGPLPAAAMALNAVMGAVAVLAVHRVASTEASRRGALVSALAIALHPGLVLYTPALMTEGMVATLLAVAAWLVVRARAGSTVAWPSVFALAGVIGLATLVRPQSLLLAPLYGALCRRRVSARLRAMLAVAVTLGAIVVCSPWTARNCLRMNACALVSVNAGWNLLIGGTEHATGAWVPLEGVDVPVECRHVWGEAEKDACFLRSRWFPGSSPTPSITPEPRGGISTLRTPRPSMSVTRSSWESRRQCGKGRWCCSRSVP